MKKSLILVAFVFILASLIVVSAVSSDIKSSYSPKETAIVKISGNILESINPSQIELRKGEFTKVPMIYDVKKLGSDQYIWFIAPENANNYTLIIRNLSTSVSGVNQKVDFYQNFTVSGDLVDYNINPGFIITSTDFTIISTLNRDDSVNIEVDDSVKRTITLSPGENNIKFNIADFPSSGIYLINFGKYRFPAYITKKTQEKNNSVNYTYPIEDSIKFVPSDIMNIQVYRSNPGFYPIYIINTGDNDIAEVNLVYNKKLFIISPVDSGIRLRARETRNLSLIVNSNLSANEINETIYAYYSNYSIPFYVQMKLTDNLSSVSNYSTGNSGLLKCVDLHGAICSVGQLCSGQIVPSSDGNCCTNLCVTSKPKSSKVWIGILIIAILILLLIFLILKYKKTKNQGNPLKAKLAEIEKKDKF